MAAGTAPTVAPDAQGIPLYAAAGVNEAATIGPYAGAAISEPDGALFGSICGIDPQVRTDDAALTPAGPVLQLLGQLLTMVLAANRARIHTALALAASQAQADIDTLTGLLNRRGWERAVDQASARFASFADPTVVVMLDLDRLKAINDEQGHEAGDAYIRAAGAAWAARSARATWSPGWVATSSA